MAYTKKTWATGEKITASALNNMETGIDGSVMSGAVSISTYASFLELTGDGTLGNLPVNRIYYIGLGVTSVSQTIPDAPYGNFYGTVSTFAPNPPSHSGAVQIAVSSMVQSNPGFEVSNSYIRYGASNTWREWRQLLDDDFREAVKTYWENTPFELIEYEKYERANMPRWNVDTSTPPVFSKRDLLNGFTRLHRCPRYLGFFINSSTARLSLYIGTVDSNGEFTPDILISRTGSGIANYISSGYNQIIDVGDTDHWFYYYKNPDPDNITIIGADEWPESDIDGLALTHYGRGTYDSSTQTYGVSSTISNNGIMLPAGCTFAVLPPNLITNANQSTCAIRTCVAAEGTDRWRRLATEEIVPFGKIPDGLPGILAALPGTYTDQCKVYIHKEVMDRANGYSEQAHNLAKKLSEIPWEVVTELYKRHSTAAEDYSSSKTYRVNDVVRYEKAVYKCNTAISTPESWTPAHWTLVETIPVYTPGKRYHGVPYSGRWQDAHWIGYEISPFTMISAIADEYSIFYDRTEGRSAIPPNDGPGMGLVCSSFGALAIGCPYPQTNRGLTWDDNFVCLPETKAVSGGLYSSGDHVLFVDEVLRDGPVTYEEHASGTGKYFYNSDGDRHNVLSGYTTRQRMYDYIFRAMPGLYASNGYDGFYTDTSNLTPVCGTIRPWRGNKSVYGPYDITAFGGIFVTIHPTSIGTLPTKIKLVKPGSSAVIDITISSGTTVMDISSHVDTDGTYTLYSDVDNTKEYFRYCGHPPVTFSFNENGICEFSSEDIDYCYGSGTGHTIPAMKDDRTAIVVYAKGVGYKRLLDAGAFDGRCYAALARDPGDENDPVGDTGSWGRYGIICSYAG